ncbi:hypothetical protein D9M72_545540 [compost metagenome]
MGHKEHTGKVHRYNIRPHFEGSFVEGRGRTFAGIIDNNVNRTKANPSFVQAACDSVLIRHVKAIRNTDIPDPKRFRQSLKRLDTSPS